MSKLDDYKRTKTWADNLASVAPETLKKLQISCTPQTFGEGICEAVRKIVESEEFLATFTHYLAHRVLLAKHDANMEAQEFLRDEK